MLKLETQSLRLTFDVQGSLTGLYSKVSGWHLLNRAHLGLSFRMIVPLEGRRNNNVWGHKQKNPACRLGKDFVEFTWDKLESEAGGTHNIKVSARCELLGTQAVFRMHIDNQDSVMVENVYYPYFGDMHRPNECGEYSFRYGAYANLEKFPLFPTFSNTKGYWGVEVPTIIPNISRYNPPLFPLGIFEDDQANGFYISSVENRIECASWQVELHPGNSNSVGNLTPVEDTIGNKDVFIRFAATHMPFLAPDKSFDLIPFGIEAYKGEWHTAVKQYLNISKQWTTLPEENRPDWLMHPHSWLQLHINSPEDELRVRYKDLPKVGEECKRLGVKVIQLVGWNYGGQDRSNPYHDIDPRLGTWQELHDAIKKIQKMEVKVILFAKFTWSDRSNKDFKSYLEPMAIKDPYGDYYVYEGYQYFTASQLNDIGTRRLVPMCFGCKEYIDLCVREFKKCVDLGADGILYDENHHHKPTLACFDENHGHRYGDPTYSHDRELVKRFREVLGGKEFLIAGESAYDDQLNYYHLAYTRAWQADHYPFSRMLRPKNISIMAAVNGFNDRKMINRCLRDNYIMSYEPYNFKGSLDDFPLTVEYGHKMEQLRSTHREYFWEGTYHGHLYASLTMEEKCYKNYSVFQSDSGKYGIVICNDSPDESISVEPTLDNGAKLSSYCMIDQQELKSLSGNVVIPPLCAAIVME